MNKGDFAKCLRASSYDAFTEDKVYLVVAGFGDIDVSITAKHMPITKMNLGSFNVIDDEGEVRFVILDGPFSSWEYVNE